MLEENELDNAVKALRKYFPCVQWDVGIRKLAGVMIEGTLGDKFMCDSVVSLYDDETIPHGLGVYSKLLMGLGWDVAKKRKGNEWLEKNKC